MTVTAIEAAPVCLCGDPKLGHRQGRKGCKTCGCEQYEPAADPTLDAFARLRDGAEDLRRTYERVTGRSSPPQPAPPEVLATYDAWLCRTCGARYCRPYTDHPCGRLTPVTVTITTAGRAA